MKWVLALMMAFGLGVEARAQASAPLTFDTLFALSPQEAAARVFGPTPEVFVERAPWNTLTPNFVLGAVGKLQMELFAAPERIAPSVCAVTMGWAIFDMGWPKDGSAEEKAAWAKLAYTQRPLSLDRWDRQREYFEAGPAPATPVVPGGKPVMPGKAALTRDSCANPVALRGRFAAPSDEVAILLVSKARAAVAAARRSGPLPFKLYNACGRWSPVCRPRRMLANLKIDWMNSIDLDGGCAAWRESGLVPEAKRCLWFELADDPTNPDSSKSFGLVLGKSDKLLEVYVGGDHGPAVIP